MLFFRKLNQAFWKLAGGGGVEGEVACVIQVSLGWFDSELDFLSVYIKKRLFF